MCRSKPAMRVYLGPGGENPFRIVFVLASFWVYKVPHPGRKRWAVPDSVKDPLSL